MEEVGQTRRDSTLAARASIGGFEEFVRRHFEPLAKTLAVITLDKQLAADAAQEALLRLHGHWDTLDELDDPVAWLYRVGINRCYDYRRQLGRATRLFERLAAKAGSEGADQTWLPELEFTSLVKQLPKQQRIATVLFYQADFSTADIARVMRISEGAVKSHLYRAREALRPLVKGGLMDNQDIDRKLREVFTRNEPFFAQSEVDLVIHTARSRRAARRGSRKVLRPVTIAVASLVVAVGVAAGAWQAIAHLGGNNPIVVITDQTTSTPATDTTSTASASSTTIAVQPLVDETQLQRAVQVVFHYFSYLKAGKSADFKKLIGPGISMDADTLWTQERAGLKKSGEAAYAPHYSQNMVWAGDQYLLPWVMVPMDIDQWIRTDPPNRVAVEVTMQDGTVRYLRVEHQPKLDSWLVVPVDALLGEASASLLPTSFVVDEQSKTVAEDVLATVKAEFPSLAGELVYQHGVTDTRVTDTAGPPILNVILADNLSKPHSILHICIQKNVPNTKRLAPSNSQPIVVAGAVSGWLIDSPPFLVQVAILLPDETMVDIAEMGLHTDQGEGPIPLDVAGMKKLVELIGAQFGTVGY